MSTPFAVPDHGVSRRRFLATVGAGAALASVPAFPGVSGLPGVRGLDATSAEAAIRSQASISPPVLNGDGILVLCTLYGGNDGLDTVVPVGDPAYAGARGALAWKPEETLSLRDGIGLHPSMNRLQKFFQSGQLAVVQGVGYPNPNRSHFRSMDIWQTGVPESAEITGWLGRWFDATGPDPLRMINVGASVPRAMSATKGGPASVPNGRITLPKALVAGFTEQSTLTNELGPLGARIAASGADLLRVQARYSTVLTGGSVASTTSLEGGAVATGDNRSVLDDQLDTVAAIVKSNSPARVFSVALGGFDTHASERGQHARLLAAVDGALGRFFDALAGTVGSKVVVMVYSEFGRRVNANLSDGTDHGTAGPVLVLGPSVRGGLVGQHPSLTKLDDGDLIYTTDFRSVYGQVLGSVLGVDPKAVLSTVPAWSDRLF